MSTIPTNIFLKEKKQLTHDVYELTYMSSEPFAILPGQFLLCDTCGDIKFRRAYSVSWCEANEVSFIVKKLEHGTGGSRAICVQEIGHEMQVWGPMGSFILGENAFPKVFIGTGTGFAPLYYMMKTIFEKRKEKREKRKVEEVFFLFGVRELRDVFYQDVLESWSRENPFDYQIYCSREKGNGELEEVQAQEQGRNFLLPEKHFHGRVTDYLTENSISELNSTNETEFYICGSPAMVKEVRSILDNFGILREKVFFEQY